MGTTRDFECDLDGLPAMLTVDEAARVLRIGRTLAYRLAADFVAGDVHGLPVVRLGGCLRVPRWALIEFIHHGRVVSDLNAAVTLAIDSLIDEPVATSRAPSHRRDRRTQSRSTAQLSLAIES
ncbi:MAG: helix-turn-helix domain-containing protein [Ilumatobacteraceae bacterium]